MLSLCGSITLVSRPATESSFEGRPLRHLLLRDSHTAFGGADGGAGGGIQGGTTGSSGGLAGGGGEGLGASGGGEGHGRGLSGLGLAGDDNLGGSKRVACRALSCTITKIAARSPLTPSSAQREALASKHACEDVHDGEDAAAALHERDVVRCAAADDSMSSSGKLLGSATKCVRFGARPLLFAALRLALVRGAATCIAAFVCCAHTQRKKRACKPAGAGGVASSRSLVVRVCGNRKSRCGVVVTTCKGSVSPACDLDTFVVHFWAVSRAPLFCSTPCALSPLRHLPSTPTTMLANLDEARTKQVFELFDKDADGKISQDELRDILKTLGQEPTDADLREMIGGSVSGLFTERGGAIDFETFKNMLVSPTTHAPPRASPVRPHHSLP